MTDPHETKRQRDSDDYNLELAGLDIGRQKRFTPESNSPESKEEKKRRDDAARYAAMNAILATQEQIDNAVCAVNDLQNKLDIAFAAVETEMDELEARTVRLDDGRAVYMTENGEFRTVDGQVVAESDLPDNTPADASIWAEYETLLNRQAQLSGIQTDVVDTSRETLSGEHVTTKDIEDIEIKIKKADDLIDGKPCINTRLKYFYFGARSYYF